MDDRLTYFDKTVKVVWQERQSDNDLHPLNTDYLNRGHFYVRGGMTGHASSATGICTLPFTSSST